MEAKDQAAVFSSQRQDWATPDWLFQWCSETWGPFDLDAAASQANARCPTFYSEGESSGLTSPWFGRVWLNPPYGRMVHRWVSKAHSATESGECDRVVMLLPARTDVAWWHDHVAWAREVCLLRGRVVFQGARDPAPFPSCLVVFGSGPVARYMDLRHLDPGRRARE